MATLSSSNRYRGWEVLEPMSWEDALASGLPISLGRVDDWRGYYHRGQELRDTLFAASIVYTVRELVRVFFGP